MNRQILDVTKNLADKAKKTAQASVKFLAPYKWYIIASVVAILILVLFTFAFEPAGEEYMTGVWVASSDFCDKSGIDSMMIVIGPAEGFYEKSRKCYVVITPNLSNQAFEIEYNRSFGMKRYNVCWKTDFDDEEIMPEEVKCEIDIMTGHMLLTADEKIYGDLYKSLDTTALVKSIADD